jgi:voltage-gated potassium channel
MAKSQPPSAPAGSTYAILRLPEASPLPGLLGRLGVAIGVILVVTILMYFGRGGLRDQVHPERAMSFIDVLYFTVISVTTVGYGDIVPVTPSARFVNAVLLTPVRVFVWITFLGTTYEIFLQRYREGYLMSQLRQRLSGHILICGFGTKGHAIVDELLAHGHKPENIVVIEPDEDTAQEAASRGLVALKGNASAEAMLQAAALEKASHVLVAPTRDDECVLICLTVRALNPKVRLIASAHEEENVKLLYRAGADVVVAPSVSGGHLMASGVRQRAVTRFLQDLLAFGKGLDAHERPVRAEEIGHNVRELPSLRDVLVLGVARPHTAESEDELVPFHQCERLTLQAGDVIVYIAPAKARVASEK